MSWLLWRQTSRCKYEILVDKILMLKLSGIGLGVINEVIPVHFTCSLTTLLDIFFVDNSSDIIWSTGKAYSRYDLIYNAKSWFSNEIRSLISSRNKAYKRWKRCRTPKLRDILKNFWRNVNYENRSANCGKLGKLHIAVSWIIIIILIMM